MPRLLCHSISIMPPPAQSDDRSSGIASSAMDAARQEMKMEGNFKKNKAKKSKVKTSKSVHQILGEDSFKRGLKRTYDEYSVEGSGVARDRFISATSYFWRKRATESLRTLIPGPRESEATKILIFLLQHWTLRRHHAVEVFGWSIFYTAVSEMFEGASLIKGL